MCASNHKAKMAYATRITKPYKVDGKYFFFWNLGTKPNK